ncbi:glycosyltransferase family 2 protein [Pedobacter kyungheensis]|uniref:glycosyltransferase family 2 protein n=1 Tax=Pedobacter kyungheensis TaxID=1069985 RepID=UPI00068D7E5F|nr:glycosyltransferase family 2 protein [Pedobacter kyungheensis]
MDRNIEIDILLSTYNGGKYLDEQLNSILSQTNSQWKIIIRDDGSSDNTLSIIDCYVRNYPDKFFLLKDLGGNLGSTLSFSQLIENCNGDYIMLCDQDDVWLDNKIEITLNEMSNLEMNFGKIPLMVFTDLKVVDQNLAILSDSMIKSQKLDVSVINKPVKLAALNVVAGCTIMINRAAVKCVLPLTSKNIIHDQWMAVNISKYGKISYVSQPTILYRQHSNNVVGSNKIAFQYFYNKLKSPLKQMRIYSDLLSQLSFKISSIEFIMYKVFFTFKRMLK